MVVRAKDRQQTEGVHTIELITHSSIKYVHPAITHARTTAPTVSISNNRGQPVQIHLDKTPKTLSEPPPRQQLRTLAAQILNLYVGRCREPMQEKESFLGLVWYYSSKHRPSTDIWVPGNLGQASKPSLLMALLKLPILFKRKKHAPVAENLGNQVLQVRSHAVAAAGAPRPSMMRWSSRKAIGPGFILGRECRIESMHR